ncbi:MULTISPECIES: LLM class F420-dependent oxidoreductase [Mycolicibacterium]|jgi:5,10-methylenetetrahydromethanopterin reductase|uniref:F420-dependent oxidoreductase, MSMEG_4879 family n=3 Tax=Mycolicibacterium fortuitum TaxID=1766 RepID=A0A0N9XMG3_MYCFO|nr:MULTISPECIES: LLM class F420-dependent oxidoreductase [Mycolicibacterium]CRL82214.1 luciferase family protein [Mycolicibacter nonchromogenicus]ALI28077.1 putative oxidoreductase [Mycolicibacterium fortuitum]AMD55407.1 LLM class F420-dependent oxidoreductase [Mycolicibacterium fortuitum subsp. fortuitum DSM 46621 = ATCC 6841 = JCM 6387]EJZ16109.1 F420-dependent methylene-tetrahydromethanopterin reductase [Mycolicibacterium fortuitum subsp. fortuitum DSM 46621 = ATCC 6841 = JCM 6387]MCA472642
MRLGVMIGAERGDMARKVSKLVSDIQWAESAGLDSAWMPQVPNDFDCLTMVALMAANTTRIELGTAVVPLQAQHPIALARQALSVHAMSGGRLALGVGPSHHWIVRDMLGLPYDKPAAYTRDYLQVLNTAIAGPGPVDVENETFTVHNPTVLAADTPMPVLVSALGPVMLQIAGEHADGTSLWMADEKAIGEHIAPKINKAAAEAGKPAPRIVAGIPVTLCANSEIETAKERANRILAEAETSPNYQRLLDRGEARNVGDLCAAGDEESILKRFKQFADAGVTDLSVRLLPIGETRDELIASKYRTREVIAELAKAVR